MPEHYYGQIVGVELYANDVVVKRQALNRTPPKSPRGTVKEFSKASRRRLAFVASNTEVPFRTMVTLTYPSEYPSDGPTVKGHLREFLTWFQKETGGCEYLWFLEFQKRGAPHFHILTDWPLPRDRDNKLLWYGKVAGRWYIIVGSGDIKHLQAGTRTEKLRKPEGGRFYAVKYAQKCRQKKVPPEYQNVGRFWGHTRAVKPQVKAQYRCTEDDVRGALEGWKYEPPSNLPVWRVLYNQADWFRQYIDGDLDKRPNSEYTGRDDQLATDRPTAPPKGQKDKVTTDADVSPYDPH
jgi:hypothetical protein